MADGHSSAILQSAYRSAIVALLSATDPSTGHSISRDSCRYHAVIAAYAEAIAWVVAQAQFSEAAKAEFGADENADAWVIAFAKAMDATVVTHEKPNPAIRRKVPIPNVCDALKVPYVDTFEMLRKLSTQFSWQAP